MSGILQELLKNSVAICFSDKVPTGKVEKYKRQQKEIEAQIKVIYFFIFRISALASKKRSNQKSSVRESKYKVPSLILETRAEILEKVLLVFWEI